MAASSNGFIFLLEGPGLGAGENGDAIVSPFAQEVFGRVWKAIEPIGQVGAASELGGEDFPGTCVVKGTSQFAN